MLSSAESAARYADKPANRNKVAQALRMARDVEGVTLRDSPPKLPKGKSKSRRSPNSSVISGGRQASASARHPTRQRVAGGAPSSRSPLASVLEQYREAETLWAQDKARPGPPYSLHVHRPPEFPVPRRPSRGASD